MLPQIRETTQEQQPCLPFEKVLLVDGDMQDLSYHGALFEAMGLTVFKCQSYDTAIRSIQRTRFDLVVVDQGSTAFEYRLVLRYLNQWQPDTPCIVVTRNATTNYRLQALKLGAVDYLSKPLSILDVDRVVRTDLGSTST